MNFSYNQLMCLKISANKIWGGTNFNQDFYIEVYASNAFIDLVFNELRITFDEKHITIVSNFRSVTKFNLLYKSTSFDLNDWVDISDDTNFLPSTKLKACEKLNKIMKLKAFF